jgi:anaerobic selenocysteine-containing dehydrogenase
MRTAEDRRSRLRFGDNVKRTLCGLCGARCGMLVEVEDGRPVRFIGDLDNPTANGKLCIKATPTLELHDHPDRLNHVLKRVGRRGEGRWEQISWQQAMDEIAAKLADIRRREGPEALATLGGSKHSPSDWSGWRFACRWGTPNIINQGRNCGSGALINDTAMYGWDTISVGTVPGVTKCLVMWGSNYPESGPLRWPSIRDQVKKGMKLIVIDPRRTKAAEIADLHLMVRPRTDGALALGWIRVLIEEGLYDKEFVEKWCLGFDEVRAIAAEWTPERTSEITGVPPELIVEAARMYAQNGPARLTFGVATTQIGEGAARSALLAEAILRAISGNLDVEGGEAFNDEPFDMLDYMANIGWARFLDDPAGTRDNVNAKDVPLSSVRGYRAYRDAMAKVHPEGHTAAQYHVFASQPHVYRAVLEHDPYPVRAIIVQSGEPLLNYGGAKLAYDAFTSDELELLVVMDHWLTPTAQLADYALPAADFLERADLNMNWGLNHFFSVGQQVVEPLYDRHNDYELWGELGRRLLDPADWPERIEEVMDRFLAPSGKTYQEWADGERNWFSPARTQWKKYEQHGFATPSGKVELVPSLFEDFGVDPRPVYTGPPFCEPDVDDEDGYPLRMITGSRVAALQGCTMRQARRLRALHPEPTVTIHPQTAATYGIAEGDWVLIERPEGSIRQRARLTEGIEPQSIDVTGYWWEPDREPGPELSGAWEANANAITPSNPKLSSFAGDQPLRGMRCRIRRAPDPTPATTT